MNFKKIIESVGTAGIVLLMTTLGAAKSTLSSLMEKADEKTPSKDEATGSAPVDSDSRCRC